MEMGLSQSSLLRNFGGVYDVKISCGWEHKGEMEVAYIGLFGEDDRKRYIIVFILKWHLTKYNGGLPVQVTEMLCIYCLKAISNPSTYIYIYICFVRMFIHT